jgi:ArsR family transcriptional regulator
MGPRRKVPSKLHEKRAQVLKAMAHPARLAMLDALADGEVCVCDLHALVGSDLSTVSKHLAVLREAGIVADRRQGPQVYYSLRVPCALNFFGCIDQVIAAGTQAGPRRVAAR